MALTPTHYSTLRLPPLASPSSIHKAYKSLALTSHPNKTRHLSPTSRAAHAKLFRRVQEAYDVLSEPGKKAAYDRELEAHGGVVENGSSTFHTAGSPSGEMNTRTMTRRRVSNATTSTATATAPNAISRTTPTRTSQSQTPSPATTSAEYRTARGEAEADIQVLLSRRAEREVREREMAGWELGVRLGVWVDVRGRFVDDVEMGAYCDGRVRALEDRIMRGEREIGREGVSGGEGG